jgi:predicted DNA-binding transcriptional regulator AlpA
MRKIIGPEEVARRTNLSRSTIWRMEKRGEFPARIQISANRVGWHSNEVDEFIESRQRVAIGSAE